MKTPYRSNANQDETEIEPPPLSYFLFSKVTIIVVAVAFSAGFYTAKWMYDKTPVAPPAPECHDHALALGSNDIADHISKMETPCVDTMMRLTTETNKFACVDPRQQANIVQNFVMCKCRAHSWE